MTESQILRRLNRIRRDKKVTFYALGKATDWSPSGLQRVLRCQVSPRLDTVLKIAEALGKKVSVK